MIKINQEAFSINNKLSKDLSALSKEIFLLEQKPDAIVNLKFISDEDIKILNQKYRNKSMPTNVLSFENDDISRVHTNEIGDIAISYEYATREAEEQKKTFHDHVMHLTLHGILHLLGYDHQLESDAEYMELKEVNILLKFNIMNPYKYE
ncbi:MAG: rRNA maturation RNase YbeY [Gammaproteobacteria bacterium]